MAPTHLLVLDDVDRELSIQGQSKLWRVLRTLCTEDLTVLATTPTTPRRPVWSTSWCG